jgi:hypothetical protein
LQNFPAIIIISLIVMPYSSHCSGKAEPSLPRPAQYAAQETSSLPPGSASLKRKQPFAALLLFAK